MVDGYAAFVAASVVLVLVPGPDMAYLLARTVAQGPAAGVVATLGINTGAYVHLIAAALGISAILATSALAFTVIKWVGAAYLLWLGIQAIRDSVVEQHGKETASNRVLPIRTIFWQGFISDVLNPKVALFFLAFLPQFIDPGRGQPVTDLLVLGLTLNMIALIINLSLVGMAGMASRRLRSSTWLRRWLQRALGAVFVSLSVRLAREEMSP